METMTQPQHGLAADEPLDAVSLPALVLPYPDGSRRSRRRALARLDTLLDLLETANLQSASSPPPEAVREFRELGLSDPEAYSLPELLAIVFQAQAAFLHPRRVHTGSAPPR